MKFGSHYLRSMAAVLVALIALPLAGCGERNINAESEPYGQPAQPQRQGLSTRQKVMLVGGAAALYYLYKKHQNKQGEGPQGRYYLSKNGRVYYRDMKTGAFQWVDPPTQPIAVPQDEYERHTGQRVTGYDDGRVYTEAPRGWNQPQGTYR
jgi:hypothetical protein